MITVILTCFNRCERTVQCINSIVQGNQLLKFHFVVVDDNSTDDTVTELKKIIKKGIKITILRGSGKLYWSGGMREGIAYAKKNTLSEFYMLINDDVIFFEHVIESMLQNSCILTKILVGPTCDDKKQLSYGGIRYTGKGIAYKMIGPNESNRACDTFNANCILMSQHIFFELPNIDPKYCHSLGDFDYGLLAKHRGINSIVVDFYIGECQDNFIQGTWRDTSLSIVKRIKLKEEIKGAPFSYWFYFLNKNFGLKKAIFYSLTPYLRILMKK